MEKVAICDDDLESVHTLRSQVERFAKNMSVEVNITEYPSGMNLLFNWADIKLKPNILYLNADMPGVNGISVAEELRRGGCNSEIIFYTDSQEEVFAAFDVDAFHYILKEDMPLEKQEAIFRRAVAKSHEKHEEHITFQYGGEHRTIKVGDIKYFTVALKVLTVYYGKDKTFEFYSNMEKVSDMLLCQGFLRINKSTLINMEHIESRSGIDVVMKDGRAFPIGRKYRANAEEEFGYFFSKTEEAR
jgi:DNA-binding LytR/AlgR family response regulator